MPPHALDARTLRSLRGGPLLRTVRRHARGLVAVWVLTAAAVLLALSTLAPDLHALARPTTLPAPPDAPARSALDEVRLRVEVAALVASGVSGAVALGLAGRVERVSLRHGRLPFALGAVLFVVGAAVGRAAVRALPLVRPPASGPYWLTEAALFLPVAAGLGVALPAVLAGGIRSGVLRRPPASRLWAHVSLGALAFAALFSPPDAATFVLFAGPPMGGVAAAFVRLGL